ncbi:hypothetical protein [Streptomyces exfoliatus]|uniref:hypothetical protein n=1 Tax=Streptomyces exfoliatus TaxID=1905 RepID=UPI003C2EE37D
MPPQTSPLMAWCSISCFLALLGAWRRDLTELRGVSAHLLSGCHSQADAGYFTTQEEVDYIRRLLERLAHRSPAATTGPRLEGLRLPQHRHGRGDSLGLRP